MAFSPKLLQMGAAGSATANFIEDVFSTFLWDGNSTARNIVNGIDLAGKGGLVWTKYRNTENHHRLYDTARGATKEIYTSLTNAEATSAQSLTAFNSDGFSLGTGQPNENTATVVGWTFRKQAKFFDVVTFTSDASNTNQRISHNLGSTPGCIFVKRTSSGDGWFAWHRSYASATDNYQFLNTTQAVLTSANVWGSTGPSSTDFGINTTVFGGSATFVAYIFAHDAGGFGTAGTDNVISCGGLTTDGSGNATVSLGYEPQWILLKTTGVVDSWYIYDTMRGITTRDSGGNAFNAYLRPNSSGAETTTTGGAWSITSTGFRHSGGFANRDWIYIAIRRGPMKTPTSGTQVFSPVARTGNSTITDVSCGFAPDVLFIQSRNSSLGPSAWDRLRGTNTYLNQNSTGAEGTTTNSVTAFNNTSVTLGIDNNYLGVNKSPNTYVNWFFGRAPSFMDEVCDTGTGSTHTISHNLAVAPELIIRKRRDSSTSGTWQVWSSKYSYLSGTAPSDNCTAVLNGSGAFDGYSESSCISTLPTSSVFSVGTQAHWNTASATYVTYLFATLAGVSKVGSYTGTGTTQTINCGFTAGARFVLIKRTDSTGDWYVWDTARGIVSGNDPYLLLNTTDAEVTNTDYIDPVNSGFEISSTAPAAINADGGTFIFLAIA